MFGSRLLDTSPGRQPAHHDRWVRFIERRKRPTIAKIAVARELAGWCWSLAVMEN